MAVLESILHVIVGLLGKLVKLPYEIREARAKALKAEAELQEQEREKNIRCMYYEIDRWVKGNRKPGDPTHFSPMEVIPAPGEDPELVEEAFKRWKKAHNIAA